MPLMPRSTELNTFLVTNTSYQHLPAAFAVMFTACCPKETTRSSVIHRSLGRGPGAYLPGGLSGFVQVACIECHLTLLCVQRHLVMPAPLRDARDGFLYCSLGGQRAKMAAEQGDVICKHRNSDRGFRVRNAGIVRYGCNPFVLVMKTSLKTFNVHLINCDII